MLSVRSLALQSDEEENSSVSSPLKLVLVLLLIAGSVHNLVVGVHLLEVLVGGGKELELPKVPHHVHMHPSEHQAGYFSVCFQAAHIL